VAEEVNDAAAEPIEHCRGLAARRRLREGVVGRVEYRYNCVDLIGLLTI
jgi:hypothetical protein